MTFRLLNLFVRLKNLLSYESNSDIATIQLRFDFRNALSHCEIEYNDGFSGGIQKKFNWAESEQLFNRLENNDKTGKLYSKYIHILDYIKYMVL